MKRDFSLFEKETTSNLRDKCALDELSRAQINNSFIDFKASELLNHGKESFEGTYTVASYYKGSSISIQISEEDFISDQFDSFRIPLKRYLLSHLGTTYPVAIKKTVGSLFYASRVNALREYMRHCYFNNDRSYRRSDRVKAKVVSIYPDFLILEIGGVECIIDNRNLSSSILPDLRTLYRIGEVIEVEIKELNLNFKERRVEEIEVSRIKIEEERIDKLLPRYHPKMFVVGRVAVNLKNGLIVYLDEGITLLAKMGIEYARPQLGDEVLVEITKVDTTKRKLYGVLRSKSLLRNFDGN